MSTHRNARAQQRRYDRAVRRAEKRTHHPRQVTPARPPRGVFAPRLKLTHRGHAGAGGGRWGLMPQLATWMGASNVVCGLYPFGVGAARPAGAVPLGEDLTNSSTVYCDPVSWFLAGFTSNPSAMIFGLPGLGKSSLVARWIVGLADRGYPPMILSDIKGEYSALIRELGGYVVDVAPGACTINPLDLGALLAAAEQVGGDAGVQLRERALHQAAGLVIALARLVRGGPLQDYEETLITLGVHLAHRTRTDPELGDLVEILTAGFGHAELAAAAVAYTLRDYQKGTQALLRTLRSILHGPMGVMFNGRTTLQIRMDNPGGFSVDMSGMRRTDGKVLAAVMIATWAHGFAAIDAQWELHRAGHADYVNVFVVQDELWKPMSLAPGLAGLIDQLARTNRSEGIAEVRITHSPKDANALARHEDRITALGFAEKAGMLITLGLAKSDLRALDDTAVTFTREEHRLIAGWRTPRSFRTRRNHDGRPKPPPGAGKALIKVGNATGIAVQTIVTAEELRLHDTNERWNRTPRQERTTA